MTSSRRSRPAHRGYLLKNLEAAELRAMLEAVGRGEAAITPAIAPGSSRSSARREHPRGAECRAGPDRADRARARRARAS